MSNWRFHFTITDVAGILGKSTGTLRGWERRGEITYPRFGTDRRFFNEDIREVAIFAAKKGRISNRRRRLIETTMTLLEQLEEKPNEM